VVLPALLVAEQLVLVAYAAETERFLDQLKVDGREGINNKSGLLMPAIYIVT